MVKDIYDDYKWEDTKFISQKRVSAEQWKEAKNRTEFWKKYLTTNKEFYAVN